MIGTIMCLEIEVQLLNELMFLFYRLFWPKSKCYDFLYQEAEELLKNFPVQATISFYQESDSSDSEDEETSEN